MSDIAYYNLCKSTVLFLLILFPSPLFASEILYCHTDNFGTPMAMTDKTGKVVWRTDEMPFGENYQTEEKVVRNDRRFLGKQLDKETGLICMGKRYLDPRTGRFTQPDPVGLVDPATGKVNQEMLLNPQRLNRYVYALNNPYKYVDPEGMDPLDGAKVNEVLQCHFSPRPGMTLKQAAAIGMMALDIADFPSGEGIGPGIAILGAGKKLQGTQGLAKAARMKNLEKGIPLKQLGPSGKPKFHVTKHSSLKKAKDAARARAGRGGTSIKHTSPTVGNKHFHGQKQNGEKIRIHDEY